MKSEWKIWWSSFKVEIIRLGWGAQGFWSLGEDRPTFHTCQQCFGSTSIWHTPWASFGDRVSSKSMISSVAWACWRGFDWGWGIWLFSFKVCIVLLGQPLRFHEEVVFPAPNWARGFWCPKHTLLWTSIQSNYTSARTSCQKPSLRIESRLNKIKTRPITSIH